ncbi:MAG: relaxase [Pseudomonadota bacterium]
MILKGNQRGHGRNLAAHLLNSTENDHVEIHELRGFAAQDLQGAFLETEALGAATPRGTLKPFYSLSVNPPSQETADVAAFERAINAAEERLGLDGQARAIVFHEKYGRRHAHVVWSRIDTDGDHPVSIRVSHDRQKLMEVSHEQFLRNGWDVPKGIAFYDAGTSKNIRHGEWMQFKRSGIHPDEHKAQVRAAFDLSDDARSFAHALDARGYVLAKGRRGHVVVDTQGEVHSVMRLTGEKKKTIEARFGNPDQLPDVAQAQTQIDARSSALVKEEWLKLKASHAKELLPHDRALKALRAEHRADRDFLKNWQAQRQEQETLQRAQRFRKGLKGLWDRLSRRHAQTALRNAQEAEAAHHRDRAERQAQIEKQLDERRRLQKLTQSVKDRQMEREQRFRREAAEYLHRERLASQPVPSTRQVSTPSDDEPGMEPEL